MKNNYFNGKALVLAMLLHSGMMLESRAQDCYSSQGCSDYRNFGINSTTAGTLEYDNYVSGFHSTAVRDLDGTLKVWGEMSQADGLSSNLMPTPINPGNYPGLTGVPLKIAVGSSTIQNVQFVLLTDDDKLWTWGVAGTVFASSLTTNTSVVVGSNTKDIAAFQQLGIGLPNGITASDVRMMFASFGNLIITTCNGDVYSIVQYWGNVGNGGTAAVNVWHKVQRHAANGGGDLTGIVAARGCHGGFIALDGVGHLWTWGAKTWNGVDTPVQRSAAVPVVLPDSAADIKMIGMTGSSSGTGNTSVYVLYENGNLFALGDNNFKQLGTWTTTNSAVWIQPRYTSGTGAVMNDIQWISPIEHDNIYRSINVLTRDKRIVNWGQENKSNLGRGVSDCLASSASLDPGEPTEFTQGYDNSSIIAVETGGHTTMALRECESNFGYVGHRVNGSMGDNSDVDECDNEYQFSTSAVKVCGAVVVDAVLNASVEGPYYVGNFATLLPNPSGGLYTISSLSTATADLMGDVLTFTGAGTLRIDYAVTSGSCGTVTVSKTFNIMDAAGKIAIPGNIWNDRNADAIVDAGTGEEGIANNMWANLIAPDSAIIASVKVNTDGSYQFDISPADVTHSGIYAVVLTNNSFYQGDLLRVADTPANDYVYTGTNRGATGVDAANNIGVLKIGDLSTLTAGTTTDPVNFGIRLVPPVAENDVLAGQTPGAPATVLNILSNDTDPGGATLPADSITLIIPPGMPAGTLASATDTEGDITEITVPGEGVWLLNDSSVTFSPYPTFLGNPTPIQYSVTNTAGTSSNIASIIITYNALITISGTIYNDIDGNGIMNGTENGNILPAPLYVYLVDGTGKIIDSSHVNSTGSYTLTGAPATDYTLQLSSNQYTPGTNTSVIAGIPAEWVITGETLNNTTNDGIPNGILTLTTGLAGSTDSNNNFGIEQPPLLVNDNATGIIGSPTVITVLGNDSDFNGGTVVTTTVTLIAPTGSSCTSTDVQGDCLAVVVPNEGKWVVDSLTGVVTFTPDPGFTGIPSPITYNADDNAGEPGSPATITLTYPSAAITGTVFNDINGDGIINGTENGTSIPAPLYVYLVDGSGKIIDSSQVSNTGSYTLTGAPATAYTLQLSNNQYTPGTNTPVIADIPAEWVITGEALNNTTNDGVPNGILALTTDLAGSTDSNNNFGIEQPPVAHNATAPGQPNPGDNNSATVPPATFDTEDAAPGGVTHIVITTLPANANSITINGTTYNTTNPIPPGGVSVPTNTNGQPTQPILVDPVNGAVTIAIVYYAVDEAGKQSAPATASVPFTTFSISGNVYHDNNGLTGSPANTVDGTGTNAGGLKAILVNTTTNTVVDVATVAANGSFSFPEADAGNYSVIITTANVSGNLVPPVVLPAGWVNSGEYFGAGAGNDGTPNGILPLGAVNGEVSNIKFGIQQLPEAYDIPLNFQLNPGGTATVPVSTLGGNDPEDGTKGTGSSFVIVTLPAQGTLYYNGIPVNAGDTIRNYAPALLQVDPMDSMATIRFQYTVLDNAGFADPTPATVSMSFIPLPLTGNVFHDANGMNDNIVNGTGIGSASGTPLYVNLVDTATNTVLASVPVNANGSYYFSTVRPDASLSVQVNTVPGIAGQPAPAVQLPNGWLPTGEHAGTGIGQDGTPDGTQMVYTGLDDNGASNVNFGIERTPVADARTISIPSVGLNVPYPLTAVPLSGNDPEEGTYGAGSSNFVFGEQPVCCAVISYNGIPLVPGTTIPNYNPELLTVTFTDIMAQQVIFTYKVVDAAGKASPEVNYIINTGTVLPVKWSVFTAKAEQGNSRLDWTTLTEIDNIGFGVERSADSRNWQEINFVSSQAKNGNSSEALSYTAYDKTPLSATNYYRLRQTDRDGKYTYSEVREVVFGANGNAISIYPNPTTDKVFVKVADWSKIKEVKMLDVAGKEVYQAWAADATEGIPMGSRAQGTYLIQIVHNNEEVSSFKIVKK